jgi:hypothetical protein
MLALIHLYGLAIPARTSIFRFSTIIVTLLANYGVFAEWTLIEALIAKR